MRRVFRQILVLTVAFALVATAAAWRQCTGLQLAAAAATSTEHGFHGAAAHHDQAASQGEHDHHAMHAQHQHGMVDQVPPAADDHGCMKCCAMCTVANAVLPAADTAMIFTIAAHVFSGDHKAWSGNTVAVDPGIPKRIV
jgi:predicted DNA repair protein MutK